MYLVVGLFLVSSLSKFTFLNNKKSDMSSSPGVFMNLGELNRTTTRSSRDDRREISLQPSQNDDTRMNRNKDNVYEVPSHTLLSTFLVQSMISHATKNDRHRVSEQQIQDEVSRMDRNKNNVIDVPDEFVSDILSNRTQD